MNNDEKYKTFIQAYSFINDDLTKYRKFLKDKRISQAERILLEGLLHLKKDKPKKALALFESTTVQSDFINGYKSYYLGLAHGLIGDQISSGKYFVDSIQYFQNAKSMAHAFRPIAAISKVYFHMRDGERLRKYYQIFLEMMDDTQTDHQILSLEYQIFIAYIEEDSEFGIDLLDQLINKYQNVLASQISTYYIYQIMLYAQMQDFDRCQLAIEAYKNSNGFKIKYNYFFFTALFNFITQSEPIYVYQDKFQGGNYYFNQLKVIQSMLKLEQEDALKYWTLLQVELPELYQDHFNYSGPRDLFSISLEKAKQNFTIIETEIDTVVDFSELQQMKSALDKLVYLFEHSSRFLNKEELIKLIWDEQWTPKNDARIRTLISRAKKKRGLNLQHVDGKYKKAA